MDATNVIAGSGIMYLAPAGTAVPSIASLPITWTGFDSPGYTDDGVEFVYSPTFKDITVDEEMSPVDKLLTAEKLEVNVKLAETTLKNLQKAIAGSSLVEGVGISTLYLGSASSTQEWILGFVGPAPLANGNASRVILLWRVKATAAVTFKYQRKDKVIYTVKFEALADSTKSAGQRLAKIQDYNSAGS
jgi:hypothetical protein